MSETQNRRFIHNPEDSEIPEPIHAFLQDLRENGMDVDGANDVMSKHQQILHPQGWRFISLNDGFGEEWNMGCTPSEGNRSYCLQRFNAIPGDPWECYIVETD